MIVPVYIKSPCDLNIPRPKRTYAFFTLCKCDTKYQNFIRSAARSGFSKNNSIFFAFDNREYNRFDGFEAQKLMAKYSFADYLILAHDDVKFLDDGREDLERELSNLTSSDSTWMLAGNAGATTRTPVTRIRYLSDPHGNSRDICRATEVQSLDENFLIFKGDAPIVASYDIGGFHLFGTDCCLQARMLGGSCYVIPFFIQHESPGGKGPEFYKSARRFRKKYRRLIKGQIIYTPGYAITIGYWASLVHEARERRDILVKKVRNLWRRFTRAAP